MNQTFHQIHNDPPPPPPQVWWSFKKTKDSSELKCGFKDKLGILWQELMWEREREVSTIGHKFDAKNEFRIRDGLKSKTQKKQKHKQTYEKKHTKHKLEKQKQKQRNLLESRARSSRGGVILKARNTNKPMKRSQEHIKNKIFHQIHNGHTCTQIWWNFKKIKV